jgi:hypothetical protein
LAHDVFLSHSSKDKTIADAVCAALEKDGIRCWIAPRDIRPGQEWPEAIVNAITKSRVMVLIFSANSNNSKDVAKELTLAMNSKVVVIPFKIDDIVPAGVMKYHLADTHWLDAMNPPTTKQIQELVGIVKTFIGCESTQYGAQQTLDEGGGEPINELGSVKIDVFPSVINRGWFWSGTTLISTWLSLSLFYFVGNWASGLVTGIWYYNFLLFLIVSLSFLIPAAYCLRRGMSDKTLVASIKGSIPIWWWAMPALLGFVGGIVSWLKHKTTNHGKAINMLSLGILLTPVLAVPLFIFQSPVKEPILENVSPIVFTPTVDHSIPEQPTPKLETPVHVDEMTATTEPMVTVTPTTEIMLSQEKGIHLVGYWPASREVNSVFIYSEKAFVANGEDGLIILDISDPTRPDIIATFPLENAVNVVVFDNIAYAIVQGQVRDGIALNDSLVLIDVENPSNPHELGKFIPEGGYFHRSLKNLAVSDQTVYLSASNQLILVDVSTPAKPVMIGEFSFSSNVFSPGLAVVDGIAYMQANRLHILDVRNPSEPLEIGGFDTSWGSSINVVDKTAYIAEWDYGLTILDVSNPSRPIKLGHFRELIGNYELLPPGASSRQVILNVSVSEEVAYVAYNFGLDHSTWMQVLESGIIAIDVSDPGDPSKIDVYSKMDETSSVYATGDLVFATDSTRGLYIFSLDSNLP